MKVGIKTNFVTIRATILKTANLSFFYYFTSFENLTTNATKQIISNY